MCYYAQYIYKCVHTVGIKHVPEQCTRLVYTYYNGETKMVRILDKCLEFCLSIITFCRDGFHLADVEITPKLATISLPIQQAMHLSIDKDFKSESKSRTQCT